MPSNANRYERLISGSDLRGCALEDHGGNITITKEDTAAAARAFAARLKRGHGQSVTVAVGHDPRISWPELQEGVFRGLAAEGCDIVDCGLATTPAMYAAVAGQLRAHGSIMITASHLPFDRNGLKFFTRSGGLTVAELEEMVAQMRHVESDEAPNVRTYKMMYEYEKQLMEYIAQGAQAPLRGMRVALDAGNGSGGFFARVLAFLGADVVGLYLDPDGRFPNHQPNPEDPEAVEALCKAVVGHGADLGVILDGDCDRAALVNGQGKVINRNRMIALVAALLLREHPGCTIVTDSVTSSGLTRFIQARGGVHWRYKRGYRNVIDEAIRLNEEGVDCPGGIETSGHCALRENDFLDDGAYLIAWLLRHFAASNIGGRKWTELIADLNEPAEDVEIRIPLIREDFAADAEKVFGCVESAARRARELKVEDGSAEGVRVHCPEGGWFMVRKSVHDPVLPVNIQADREGGARPMVSRLLALLAPVRECVDTQRLEEYVANLTSRPGKD